MSNPNWAEVCMAIGALGSFIATSIGLYAVFVQIRKLGETLTSDTQGRLCDQSIQILRLLADRPETYDYFYNGKRLANDAPERIYVLYAAEAIANFMEHLALQAKNLPKRQWLVWDRFIRNTYERSAVLQEFFDRHHSWYANELHEIIANCDRVPSGDVEANPVR